MVASFVCSKPGVIFVDSYSRVMVGLLVLEITSPVRKFLELEQAAGVLCCPSWVDHLARRSLASANLPNRSTSCRRGVRHSQTTGRHSSPAYCSSNSPWP